MILEAYACSDVGIQRTNNEDNIYFNGIIKDEQAEGFNRYEKLNLKNGSAAFAVFDGMGGYSKGERASYITATATKAVLADNNESAPENILKAVCSEANVNVCEEIKVDKNLRMGSTLSMLYFEKNKYHICNVGDSPIFLFRDGGLKKISLEHTEASVYRKIYGEEPPKGKKFPLTQHIGIPEDKLHLDPYYSSGDILENDIFLICSDGLTDMLDDEEIVGVLSSNEKISIAGDMLRKRAIEHGGLDNITLVLIKANIMNERINVKKSQNQNDVGKKSDNGEANREEEKRVERRAVLKIAIGTIFLILLTIVLSVIIKNSHENISGNYLIEQSYILNNYYQ